MGGRCSERHESYRRARLVASARAVLVLAVLVACPAAASPQKPPTLAEATPELRWRAAADRTRAFAVELMEQAGLPGLQVAVAVRGQLAFSQGFGFADLENRVPVTELTRFRIGSVSKSVTSAALGLLIEERKLDIDAPIQRYVSSFPEKRWPISTRQVAGHIAGIRHYRGNENLLARRWANVRAGLDIFKDDSLLFEPGTRYSYSSYGWNLLSAVIEGASGEDFLVFMRRRIFEPLALRSLTAEHTDSIIPYRARFYQRDANNRLENAPYVDNSYKWAGGGFIGTTEDLVRFGTAMLKPGFLQQATLTTLFTPQRLRDGSSTDYGMGWGSGTDPQGRRTISHTGGSVGGRAVLVLYPDQEVVVAMLANAGHAPMSVANAVRVASFYVQ